jgi:hypothetical protein
MNYQQYVFNDAIVLRLLLEGERVYASLAADKDRFRLVIETTGSQ